MASSSTHSLVEEVSHGVAGFPARSRGGSRTDQSSAAAHAEFVICDHTIDITYVRLRRGFVYLAAVLDWYSRYVLSWALSNSLEVGFCLEVLEAALARGQPEIFNTDQGAQFTSPAFTGRLLAAGVQISMDGRGRALDNVFGERLWRSVKYEEVSLQDYRGMSEAHRGLGRYFGFYNAERPHQALGYRTPLRYTASGEPQRPRARQGDFAPAERRGARTRAGGRREPRRQEQRREVRRETEGWASHCSCRRA